MLRLRISKIFDFMSHKNNGFQSVKTDCKFEDTHGLISNIELKTIDSKREIGGGGTSSGHKNKTCVQASGSGVANNVPGESEITVVPPRCLENRVYSSPSEDIIAIGGGFGEFGVSFCPNRPLFKNNCKSRSRDDESSVMLGNDNGRECMISHREGTVDGNHNNSSSERDDRERYEVAESLSTQPKQICLLLLICLVGLVMLTAMLIVVFMIQSHGSNLITKTGDQAQSPDKDVSVGVDTSDSNFAVVSDLHEKFPNAQESAAFKSPESIMKDIHEIFKNLNFTSSEMPDESVIPRHPSNSNEEKSYEKISEREEKVKVESKSSARPILSEDKRSRLAKIIDDSVNEEYSSHVSQLLPVDPLLQIEVNATNYIINEGFFREELYKRVVERDNLTVLEANEGLILFDDINITLPSDKCKPFPKIECKGLYEYRTFDGSCNNLRHPSWGKANEPYRRIAFPVYSDGVSLPRSKASNGQPLPNPREISMTIHIDEFREDSEVTLLLRNWAQFVEHDILNTLSVPTNSSCCDAPRESECISIPIPRSDTFFSEKGVHCLPVSRSAPHFMNCSLGPREQFNQMSSYLDASNIYGSSVARNKAIRYIDYGRLRTSHTDDRKSLLPIRPDPNDECNQLKKNEVQLGHYCFLAGDPDVNKEATLTALHTIWVRHHNHVAKVLFKHNPHWDDERVFQETRKIISAQIQHITYNEFLPELLPENLLKKKSLKLEEHEFFTEYDASVDPTVSNAFTTVFQFTQSMVQGLVKTICAELKNEDYEQIHKLINNPFMLWTDGKLGSLIRGIISQKAQQVDHYISGQLTHLYNKNQTTGHGSDLAAEIIQRGRDHGLPPYLQWRVECGLSNVTEFEDLENVWDPDALDKIRSTYKSVMDVDLFTGMLAEKHIRGGRVGPTIACLIADQFSRLRRGDRFWYEGNIYMKHFSIQQLNELRRTTLARIICDSGEGIKSISLRPMVIASRSNPLVDCSNVPKVTFSLWKEKNNSSSPEDKTEMNNAKSSLDVIMNELSQEEWTDSYEYSEHDGSSNPDHTHSSSPPVRGKLITFTVRNNTRL